jgi:hypothetical protein
MFLLVVVLSVHVYDPKEPWTDNPWTKRNMERQYNDQKKHGQAFQRQNLKLCLIKFQKYIFERKVILRFSIMAMIL